MEGASQTRGAGLRSSATGTGASGLSTAPGRVAPAEPRPVWRRTRNAAAPCRSRSDVAPGRGFYDLQRWVTRPISFRGPRELRFVRTGRCEPVRDRHGPESIKTRRARRADPPSGGPSRLSPRRIRLLSQMVEKVLLASPRGYCAGVERAVETVERALELYGRAGLRPQADRPQPARRARARGARRDLRRRRARRPGRRDDGALRARRRPVRARERRRARELRTIDATCPLVTKVHVQARRYAAEGYTVVLIGHAGHEEVVGTMGEIPDSIVLVESQGAGRDARAPGRREARVRHPDDALGRRDARGDHARSASASRRSVRRSARTSVTRPPTGSGR